jgi:hypothetical protein
MDEAREELLKRFKKKYGHAFVRRFARGGSQVKDDGLPKPGPGYAFGDNVEGHPLAHDVVQVHRKQTALTCPCCGADLLLLSGAFSLEGCRLVKRAEE